MRAVFPVRPIGPRLALGVLAFETYLEYWATRERRSTHFEEDHRRNPRDAFGNARYVRLLMRTRISSDFATWPAYLLIVGAKVSICFYHEFRKRRIYHVTGNYGRTRATCGRYWGPRYADVDIPDNFELYIAHFSYPLNGTW